MIRKIILDGQEASITYSPKLQDLHLPSREKKEQQKESRRLLDIAVSHYNRGWFQKAKSVLLNIAGETVDIQLYQDALLRTYRKLIAQYTDKEQYHDALAEMQEMFENCPNTTGGDNKKYNNLLEILKKSVSGSLLELKKREPGPQSSGGRSEFTGRKGVLSCIFQVKHPPDFKFTGGHAIDALKLISLSHLLPSSLPYLDLEEIEEGMFSARFFSPPKDRADHDMVRFKAANGGFIACPGELLVFVYDWYLQEKFRFDIESYVADASGIRCVDVAPDLSSFLFCLNDRLFLLDAPDAPDSSDSSPKMLFTWDVSRDIDHSVSSMFGTRHQTGAVRVTGTGFSWGGDLIYVGCSNGSVYRMDKEGRIHGIYVLPANLRYVHGDRLTVKHIVDLRDYLHIYAENEILVIQRNPPEKLVRVIKVNDGEIKWFGSDSGGGFVHLVYHDVYVYSADGALTDVLEFKQKPRHLCGFGDILAMDCDDKLYVFRLPPVQTNETRRLKWDPDAAEFSPVLASGVTFPDTGVPGNSIRGNLEPGNVFPDYAGAEAALNARTPLWKYFHLARSVAEDLGDKAVVRRILMAAQEVMPASLFNRVKLAALVAKYLEDPAWVAALHRGALEVLRNDAEFRALAFSLVSHGQNKEEAYVILSGVMEKSSSASKYTGRARIIAEALDRPELASRAEEVAEKRFMSLSRLENLFDTCLMELEELSDARKIPHVEIFLEKHMECLNIKEILYRVVSLFQPLDREQALSAYVRYYMLGLADPQSLKPLPLKVRNRVFDNEEQSEGFEKILREIKASDDRDDRDVRDDRNNIDQLETKIRRLFIPRHKPIRLDSGRIDAITRQHEGTVQKLGKVLSEPEDEAPRQERLENQNPSDLDSIFAAPRSAPASMDGALYTPVHLEFLKLLAAHDGSLPEAAVLEFTRARKLFKNQLIDGINQLFYDAHEDILLEDTPPGVLVNPDFLDMIRAL